MWVFSQKTHSQNMHLHPSLYKQEKSHYTLQRKQQMDVNTITFKLMKLGLTLVGRLKRGVATPATPSLHSLVHPCPHHS